MPRLPAIPFRSGPLSLSLIHPAAGANLGAVDSTFVYGSTGSGEARLWIDGVPIEVQPNGAFLAYLPVPASGTYRLLAAAGSDTISLERQVTVAPPPPSFPVGTAGIVPNSISPRGGWTALPGERIEVEFRGAPGGVAALLLPSGKRVPLVESPRAAHSPDPVGLSRYRGYFAAEPIVAGDTATPRPTLVTTTTTTTATPELQAFLELVVGTDTARTPIPLNLALADPQRPVIAVAAAPLPPAGSGTLVGRPGPGFTYAFFWPNETLLTLTGERNSEYRVQLTPELVAWVARDQVRRLPAGTPPPGGGVGTLRLSPAAGYVDLHVALPGRLPFQVAEGDDRIELTVFGGIADTDWLLYDPTDPLIRRAEWRQPATGTYQVVLYLNQRPWGYQTFWDPNGGLVLRLRRPPTLDPSRPLRGLLIAVDAGHPPGGATGPTGLTEAEANLSIALKLRPLLERAGARVLMTRTTMEPLGLNERTNMATAANADLLISIHNNAFPEGVDPFPNNGTSVYFNHPQSLELARALQHSLLAEFGLRDLGIGRADLALVRPTWMPAVLTESLFMMIPEQEAALRDPEVQERLARAHFEGIEIFLREYADGERSRR